MAEYKSKYLVIKLKDIAEYLSQMGIDDLEYLLSQIAHGRDQDGKTPNSYYVVNQDEPYADQVIDLIIKEETALEQD